LFRLNLGLVHPIFYIKAAAVATNLSSDKVVDGISKLLSKTDLSKLNAPAHKDKTIAANGVIKVVEEHCSNGYQAGFFDQDAFDELMGKYMVRTMLLLTDKQHLAKEKTTYKSQESITDVFVQEFLAQSGAHLDAATEQLSNLIRDGPTDDNDDRGPTGSVPSVEEKLLLTPEEMADPIRTLNKLKSVPGAAVIQTTNSKDVYKILEVGSTVVVQMDHPFNEKLDKVRAHVC